MGHIFLLLSMSGDLDAGEYEPYILASWYDCIYLDSVGHFLACTYVTWNLFNTFEVCF